MFVFFSHWNQLCCRLNYQPLSPLLFTFCNGRKRQAGGKGPCVGVQPRARKSYNIKMSGCDINDQLNGARMIDHKSKTFFWRRVFEGKFFTAITNACLLKKMWVVELTEGIDKELELVGPLDEDEVKEGPMTGTSRCTLMKLKQRLKHVERMEKAKWDMDLCDYPMAKCNRGHACKGLHQHLRTPEQVLPPPRPASAKWEQPLPSNGRTCDNPECGSRTKGACRCTDCGSGVVMCMKCFLSNTAHAAARTARFAQERPMQTRRKRPIDWSKFDRQQRQRNTPNV